MKNTNQKHESEEFENKASHTHCVLSEESDCTDYLTEESSAVNIACEMDKLRQVKNRNQGQVVWLPAEVENSMQEVVDYHWCYEQEDCEEDIKNGYDGQQHIFKDKLLVDEWLNNQKKSWSRTRKIRMLTDVLLLVGICLLGILNFTSP